MTCFDKDLIGFWGVKKVVLMLTCRYLKKKCRELFINAVSPPASLAFIGQVTKHTTCKLAYSLRNKGCRNSEDKIFTV